MISYMYNYFFRLLTTDLFNFSGCEGRLTYFLFLVNTFIFNAILPIVFDMVKGISIVNILFALFAIVWIIVSLIAHISLIVRRLRDINTSVFLFFLILVPGINIILVLFLLFYPGERSI